MEQFTWNTLIFIALIGAATWIARTVAARAIARFTKRVDTPLTSTSLLSNITQVIILFIGGGIILQTLGVAITPLITALGVGGFAVALGLQSTLSNIFSGLTLIAAKLIQPGDVIELEGDRRGKVQDISWRYTTLSTATGSLIIVPNAFLANNVVTNHARPNPTVSLTVTVHLPLTTPTSSITALDTALSTLIPGTCADWLEPESTPLVRLKALDQHGITVTVTVRAKTWGDQFPLRHAVVGLLLEYCQAQQLQLLDGLDPVYAKGGKNKVDAID